MKMKFALVNGHKMEPQPGLKGTCINCQSDVIAKCGKKKIWHWAHKSKISCDPWWENQTEWHRVWKNHFPEAWQEISNIDSATGEKHIADVKTPYGLVIEFQHSAISATEVQSRETFHKQIVWVVDGTRLKNDYPHFCKGFEELGSIRPIPSIQGFFLSAFPEECFPKSWLTSSAPIYFDFQGSDPANQQDQLRSPLWCLYPGRVEGNAVVAGVSRKQFIELASADPTHLLLAREILNNISQIIRLQRQNAAIQQTRAVYPQYVRRRR